MVVSVLQGDCRAVLPTLEPASVQCCVTSPPYFGLRDYGVEGQIGLESTVEAYVAEMVSVFREVRRVLRDDGVLWLNLGDSYASTAPGTRNAPMTKGSKTDSEQWANMRPDLRTEGIKAKDLIGIPWRVAFALQADGWYLRSEVTWCKRAPMPESVTDRPTSATEKLFLFAKSPRYFYDAAAVAEPAVSDHGSGNGYRRGARLTYDGRGSDEPYTPQATRNLRNFWILGPESFAGAHFAVMPTALVEPCIKSGTSEKGACTACGAPWVRLVEREGVDAKRLDRGQPGRVGNGRGRGGGDLSSASLTVGWGPSCTCYIYEPSPDEPGICYPPRPCMVLDPFGGAGTVGLVADRLGRDAVLIELNPQYAQMSRNRVIGDAPLFAEVS